MIRSIHIRNFKSIQDTGKITFSKLNALIGKNGVGKSNLISAIKLFKNLAEGEKLSSLLQQVAPMDQEFFKWGDYSNRSIFEFQIEALSGKHYLYKFLVKNSNPFGSPQISEEYLVELDSYDQSKESQVVFHREEDSVTSGKIEKDVLFNIDPDKLLLANYKDIAAEDIVSTVSRYWFIDENIHVESGMRAVNVNNAPRNKIDEVVASLFIKDPDAFKRATEILKKILDNFEAPIVRSINDQEDRPTRTSVQGDKSRNFYFVLWKSRFTGGNHTHHSLSGGERRIVHLVFSLFSTAPKSLFVVEEIENGIHFALIRRLMDEFKTQAYNRKIQVLFTTHSPDVMATVSATDIIWVRCSDQSGTNAKNLTDTSEFEEIKSDINDDVKGAMMSGMFD